MAAHVNNFPKLHNAAWPGLVGKGPDSEPPLDLDTMINHTANAQVDGVRFDGMDLFLFDPHISIDITDDQLKRLADKNPSGRSLAALASTYEQMRDYGLAAETHSHDTPEYAAVPEQFRSRTRG